MMEVQIIEKKGKSVDEAIQSALEELSCDIEDVSVEVVEEPTKGLLGIGKKPALVRVTKKEKPEEEACNIIQQLLEHMKIDYQVNQAETKEGYIHINLSGNDMGLLIGRRGETLDALQFVTGLILNRKKENRVKVLLDVEDYRKKREESIESLALKLSDRVKSTRKNVVMRPMSSQERRIVHSVLQNDAQITTFSTGDEPNRKVVISLKK